MLGLLAKMAATSPKVEVDLSALENALDVLTPRSRQVLVLRYGLGAEEPHSLAEIGERLHLTPQRVWQMEQRAIQILLKGRIYRVTVC